MKKKKVLKSILVLLSLAVVCAAVHFTVNPTFDDVSEADDPGPKIAESWLTKQISLRDYELIEAHCIDPDLNGGKPCVAMTYSVKPRKSAFEDWYAGNGELGEDGWIVEKSGYITWDHWCGWFIVTGLACNTGPSSETNAVSKEAPGNVDNVRIETVDSALYTQQDIDDAIAVILEDFKSFTDCTLTRIAYAGDEITQKLTECHLGESREAYIESWGDFDELIILYSDFTVDSTRHNSLMKGPYTDWNWILVRQDGGPWRHVDHGY